MKPDTDRLPQSSASVLFEYVADSSHGLSCNAVRKTQPTRVERRSDHGSSASISASESLSTVGRGFREMQTRARRKRAAVDFGPSTPEGREKRRPWQRYAVRELPERHVVFDRFAFHLLDFLGDGDILRTDGGTRELSVALPDPVIVVEQLEPAFRYWESWAGRRITDPARERCGNRCPSIPGTRHRRPLGKA